MRSISRRDFIKGAAAGAVGVAALGMMGGAGMAEEGAPAEGTAIPSTFTDGSYFTEAISMHGPINVQTDIENGAIANVKVLNHNETWVIGESAVDTMPGRIVAEQSLNVDTVSGATITSLAILKAVSEAITLAGGDPDDFNRYTEPAKVDAAEEIKADVGIVGAGMAGLIAAWQLAEAGKRVVVFEKMPVIGGCLPMTSTEWTAAGTKLHREYGLERDPLTTDFKRSVDAHIQLYKDFLLDAESPRYNPDMPYFTVLANKVSEISDKLIDLHVPFMPIHETKTPQLSPGQFSMGSKTLLSILQSRLDLLGVEIIKEATVKALSSDGERVTGFTAAAKDGTTYQLEAKAVLLASGGFVMNRDMMQEYNPDDMKYYIAGPKWATGDGMLMARELGAGYDCMECGVTSHYTAAKSLAEISFIHYIASPGIIVNGNGERFVSESLEYKVALKSFKSQASDDFYWIFDERGRQNLHPRGNSYRMDYTFLLHTGDIVEASNIEELQEKTGLLGLVETVSRVNDCALKGTEDEFGNTKLSRLLSGGKMYALKVIPSPYIAQGGLKIDPAAHVQREDASLIPGLYAAGDVTGSVECRDSAIYRIGLSQALAYGYAACETILREI